MASPLIGAPPQPTQVGQPGPPPSGPMQGLVGDQANGTDQSLQIVTQHLMEAEQALQAAAKIKPELSAIVDKFINEVKPQAGQLLFGGGQPQPQPSLMGILAGGAGPLNSQP